MSYKKVIIKQFGEINELELVTEKELPEPASDEVRVKVQNACANFTDVMIRKGMYPDVKEKPPFTPGYDMVGVVDKIGNGVENFKKGDRVADMTVIGSYAEYMCIPAEKLIKVPESLDAGKAVSLVLSYVTAYQMMFREANIQKGQSILVHGASGAVGQAMLQLAKHFQVKVFGTASHEKHNMVSQYNAIPIDYKSQDFVEEIKKQTDNGVDAVFDAIGGKNFKKSFKTLKPGGKLIGYGFYNAVMGKGGNIPLEFMKLMLWNLLPNGKKTSFYSIGAMRNKHPEWYKQDLEILFGMLERGEIQPPIDRKMPLSAIKEAHELIESGNLKGKIIIDNL